MRGLNLAKVSRTIATASEYSILSSDWRSGAYKS